MSKKNQRTIKLLTITMGLEFGIASLIIKNMPAPSIRAEPPKYKAPKMRRIFMAIPF